MNRTRDGTSLFVAGVVVIATLQFFSLDLQAAPVTEDQAALVARNWMLDRTGLEHDAQAIPPVRPSGSPATRSRTYYRVFNTAPDGWVIVSSDDVAYPIVAYSPEGSVTNDEIPPAFAQWMKSVNTSIRLAAQRAIRAPRDSAFSAGSTSTDLNEFALAEETSAVIAEAWDYLSKEDFEPAPKAHSLDAGPSVQSIAPLIRTTWSQRNYYNQFCPTDSRGPDGHTLVGCCATAMGQILRYHGSPTTGNGSHSYLSSRYGTLSANFGATTYNWAAMPSASRLTSYNPSVATLLFHAGISVDMNYGPSYSGCNLSRIGAAFRNYFGYWANDAVSRASYSDSDWTAMIRTDLDANQPILYAGLGTGGVHAFVLDGYNEFGYYHFNWGWDGAYDGYFLLSNLNPGGISFTNAQCAVFRILPGGGSVPTAPSSLKATAVSSTQINLTWLDNSANEFGFSIERKMGVSGAWAPVTNLGINVTSYSSTGLMAGTTYYYRVRAFNAAGRSSYSNEASAIPGGPIPAAPSSLTATAASSSQINLTWRDNSTNEGGFIIERKTGVSGTWAPITNLGINVTSYSSTGLMAGTTYYYRVLAQNAAGRSAYSNEAYAATSGIVPFAPSSLTATAASSSQINLTWRDNSTNEGGFMIERKTGVSGTWAPIINVGINVTSYSSTGLMAGTTYYYRVLAQNAAGRSAYSNEASAATSGIVPFAPSSLSATAASSSQINLTWRDNSTNESGFIIERKTGVSGTWVRIASVGANVISFPNTGLLAGTSYFYRALSYTASGRSAYSNEAGATTYGIVPAAPSALSATAASFSQINLTWRDNSTNEAGFTIERKTGISGAWGPVASLGANVTSYSSMGLIPRATYYYRVRAYNMSGPSSYSNEAYATTPDTAPAAPFSLTATVVSSSQVNLSWRDNSTNESGFYVERKTGVYGAWAPIATVSANVINYSNTGLLAGVTYFYRVLAYNTSGRSAPSNEAYATTAGLVPIAPSSLAATAASSTQINLMWRDNSTNEAGFYIERKTGISGAWATIVSLGANVTTYSNTGLMAGAGYFYRVRAYNGSGASFYSNEVYAATPLGSCASSTSPISSGTTLGGTLAITDCVSPFRSTSYYDNFTFTATAGRSYTITLSSTAFDAYLYLRNSAGAVLASNDNYSGRNSQILYRPTTSGTLMIHATSYGGGSTGVYTVSLY
jgi:transcriptional regulator CtsR